MTTIADIAKITGCSKATVSRVINGLPGVGSALRERVQQVLDAQYYPSSPARAQSGNPNYVLIINGDPGNYFCQYSASVLETMLSEKGFLPFICNCDDDDTKELYYLNFADNLNFAGAIVLTIKETSAICEKMQAMSCPVILMNRPLKSFRWDSVYLDPYYTSFTAVQYLIKNGHKRIFHLCSTPGVYTSDERIRGYHNAMQEAKLPIEDGMELVGDFTYDSGYRIASELKISSKYPIAIFIDNDTMAVGFLKGCTDNNISIPEDVSIICFNSSPTLDQFAVPITSVGKNAEALCAATVDLLLKKMEDPASEIQHVVFFPEISERKSVLRI